MKSEQEMQFADPDWKPTGPLVAPENGQRASVPPPSASQAYDAYQADDDLPVYEQGYRAGAWQEQEYRPPQASAGPYMDQTSYYAPATSGRRGHAPWWLWLLILILLLSLLGSIHTFSSSSHAGDFHRPYYRQGPSQHMGTFDLNGATGVTINDPLGSVIVQVSGDVNQSVLVDTDGNSAQVGYQGTDMTITPEDASDLTVIIPQGLALNLKVGDNSVEVDGFTGQLNAQTNGGQMTLTNDMLSQGSSLTTNSGTIDLEQGALNNASVISTTGAVTLNGVNLGGQVTVQTGGQGFINFNGSLDPQGHYQFATDSGNISLSVPYAEGSAADWQITQKSGNYLTDFPGRVGSAPQYFVGVTTGSGDITINKQ